METFVAFAALTLILPLAFLAVPPAVSAWRRRHEAKRFYRRLINLDRKPAVVLPPAEETSEAVMRFRRAVLHSGFEDYFRP
jgi:hypothetical protein